MTTTLRKGLDQRRHACARYLKSKSQAHARARKDADKNAKSEIRVARRAHSCRVADRVNKIWSEGPGGHAAFKALKSTGLENDTSSSIPILKSTDGKLHTDTPKKLDILEDHYRTYATPPADRADLPSGPPQIRRANSCRNCPEPPTRRPKDRHRNHEH